MEKFKKNKLAMIGLIIIIIFIVGTIIIPFFIKQDINKVDLSIMLSKPNSKHLLGTDEMGRDVLGRLIYGGRVSLLVGFLGTFIQITIGVTLGTIAGYFGGILDSIIMRLVDIFMCFPFFIIAITMAALLGPSILNVIIIIGVLSWTGICRIVRGEILSLKEKEFIEASRAIGLNSFEIITKHIIPNILSPILICTTLSIADGILTEASLSFLGMGVKLPNPSWGNMLASAQNISIIKNQWWLWIPPGLSVLFTVLSINFIGDGLRKAFDPKIN